MKNVLIPMSGDLLHIGHLKALQQCAHKGNVIVGLLSDECIAKYKGKPPVIPYSEREMLINCLAPVYEVRKQDSLTPNLEGMDYLASGDGFEPAEKEAAKKYNCELLDITYYQGQSTTKIKQKICEKYC